MPPSDENIMIRFSDALYRCIDGPITWFRKSIVEPNQKDYSWYHRVYNRVPTIDQCYCDDSICKFEANQQFRRDRLVDSEILTILRQRFEDCIAYEHPDIAKCQPLKDTLDKAVGNWFTKYGDLGAYGDAEVALLKQKHRLVWERRHGPVGSGMKPKSQDE